MIPKKVVERFRVDPGEKFRLADHDPGWEGTPEMRRLGEDALRARARERLARNLAELAEAQQLLYANDVYALLVILQGIDAAGKDGIVRHVMSGLNPQGCQAFSFKKPSDEELDHHFLWRYSNRLPERGRVGIFNRSYYEEVLVVRVHPELLERQKLPPGKRDEAFWEKRYQDINNFEKHLVRNGTVIVKFFLNISKKEQKKRFLERLEDPRKHWKFSAADLEERRSWDAYMEAFEQAIAATSTKRAPWYVIPANHKWVARTLVADILASTIRSLDLEYPRLTKAQLQVLAGARRRLERE